MAQYLSAGVYASEIDASASVPSVATGIAAYAGSFTQGPVYKRTLVTTIEQLIAKFGLPTDSNYNDWYQCYNFLKNGSELYVVRAVSNDDFAYFQASAYNATRYYNIGDIVVDKVTNPTSPKYYTAKLAGFLSTCVGLGADNESWNLDETPYSGTTGPSTTYSVNGVSITQKHSMNAGAMIGLSGVSANNLSYAFSKAIYNDDKWDIDYITNLPDNISYKFVSKSTGVSGNNIKVSIGKTLTSSVEALVNTTWNGAGTEDIWDATTTYDIGEVAIYNNLLYKSNVANNTGKRPGLTYVENGVSMPYWSYYTPTWSSVTTYKVNDIVNNGGKLFKAKVQNTNITPSTDYASETWLNISHKLGDVVKYGNVNWTSLTSENGDVPTVNSKKWQKGTTFSDLFESSLNVDNNELAVVIYNGDSVVEKFIVSSNANGVDEDGNSNFIETVLNSKSNYVWCKLNASKTFAQLPTVVQQVSLSGGILTDAGLDDLIEAYDMFSDTERFDVSVIIANEKINKHCVEISLLRKDCITIAGMSNALVGAIDPMETIITYTTDEAILNDNSYAAFYGNYIQIYDAYNAKYRWINIAGAVAGSQIRTNNNRDPWWANAGLERGQIAGITKIAFNPTQGERDVLYRNKINPIVSFPGQGNCIIWGQKTLLSKKSAFDRLNVRLLFLVIEKAVNKAMKYFVFEPNDEFTRAQVTAMIIPFMENIKGRRGVYDYKVICDDTINTQEVIDSNILKLNVLIKPTRTAEFVEVKYVASRTDADLAALAKSLP
jgi:phage tail sheath protein FI